MTMIRCPSCGNAIDVPEKRSGLPWLIGCLVALVAIPVIVAVIGLMAAIAIPSFVKARDIAQRHACINNMKQIDAAKEQTVFDQKYQTGAIIPEDQISKYLKGGLSGMVCPKGGDYTVNPIGQDPACSIHGKLSEASQKRMVPNQASEAIDAEAVPQPQH